MELIQIERFIEAAAKKFDWEWGECPHHGYLVDEHRWLAVEERDKNGNSTRARCTDCGQVLYWHNGKKGSPYGWCAYPVETKRPVASPVDNVKL